MKSLLPEGRIYSGIHMLSYTSRSAKIQRKHAFFHSFRTDHSGLGIVQLPENQIFMCRISDHCSQQTEWFMPKSASSNFDRIILAYFIRFIFTDGLSSYLPRKCWAITVMNWWADSSKISRIMKKTAFQERNLREAVPTEYMLGW